METTSLQTLEINIPEKYVSIVRKFIKSLGGTVKLKRKEQNQKIYFRRKYFT